jgi:hypothetical protein
MQDIEAWKPLLRLKTREETVETLHHRAHIANPWESDYPEKDVTSIGGQFQGNMLGLN